MAFDFPASPTVGQAFNGWVWDGEKWQMQGSAAQGAVRYDIAQGLNAAQATQARSNIYAAPMDALAYSGMQVNGSMDVRQEGGVITINDRYICDGWKLTVNGTPAVTGGVDVNSSIITGLVSSLYITVGTAAPSLGAADIAAVYTPIEGYRVARLAWGTASAQSITIAFWSKHKRAGLYTGVVRNAAQNRSYGFTYTQTAADTAQYNAVTVPGDTAGTWVKDNGIGMTITFAMACGATYTTPSANSWLAGGPYVAASGQVNGAAATSDVFLISGVVVLPGIEAPSAARSPLIMRPYDQELLTCQRYFEMFVKLQYCTAFANSATLVRAVLPYQQKRAAPTVTFAGTFQFNASGTLFALSGIGSTSTEATGQALIQASTSGATVGAGGALLDGSASSIKIDARL